MGTALSGIGEHAKAEARFRSTHTAACRTLGKKHVETARFLNNLAWQLDLMGRSVEAVPMYLEVIETYTLVLGLDHPQRLRSEVNLATALSNAGQFKEAEIVFVRAEEALIRVEGPYHQDTLIAQSNRGVHFAPLERRRPTGGRASCPRPTR